MKNRKILLIGGSGFLGQAIIKLLLKEEISFFYADLKPINGIEEKYIPLNIFEANDFMNLDTDFSLVINLTGQVTTPTKLCFQQNTKGIQNIINFVKQNKINFIQTSTLSVYGSSVNEINENSELNPETPYGTCKAIAEYLTQKELPVDQHSIIRISNLYGDNQNKGILSYLLRSIKKILIYHRNQKNLLLN